MLLSKWHELNQPVVIRAARQSSNSALAVHVYPQDHLVWNALAQNKYALGDFILKYFISRAALLRNDLLRWAMSLSVKLMKRSTIVYVNNFFVTGYFSLSLKKPIGFNFLLVTIWPRFPEWIMGAGGWFQWGRRAYKHFLWRWLSIPFAYNFKI